MTYTTNEMVLPRNFAMHSEDEMMYLDGGRRFLNFQLPKSPVRLSIWGVTCSALSWVIKTQAKTSYTRRVVRGGKIYTVSYNPTEADKKFADKICTYITIASWFTLV